MTNAILDDAMWDHATRDHATEHERTLLSTASVAAAPLWGFLVSAESEVDFHNRMALSTDRLHAIARTVAGEGTPDYTTVVSSLPAQWFEDWQMAFEARQVETQRRNAPRAAQRAQERRAAKAHARATTAAVDPGMENFQADGGPAVVPDPAGDWHLSAGRQDLGVFESEADAWSFWEKNTPGAARPPQTNPNQMSLFSSRKTANHGGYNPAPGKSSVQRPNAIWDVTSVAPDGMSGFAISHNGGRIFWRRIGPVETSQAGPEYGKAKVAIHEIDTIVVDDAIWGVPGAAIARDAIVGLVQGAQPGWGDPWVNANGLRYTASSTKTAADPRDLVPGTPVHWYGIDNEMIQGVVANEPVSEAVKSGFYHGTPIMVYVSDSTNGSGNVVVGADRLVMGHQATKTASGEQWGIYTATEVDGMAPETLVDGPFPSSEAAIEAARRQGLDLGVSGYYIGTLLPRHASRKVARDPNVRRLERSRGVAYVRDVPGEWTAGGYPSSIHIEGPDDISPEFSQYRDGQVGDLDACGWCYLHASHSVDAHVAEKARYQARRVRDQSRLAAKTATRHFQYERVYGSNQASLSTASRGYDIDSAFQALAADTNKAKGEDPPAASGGTTPPDGSDVDVATLQIGQTITDEVGGQTRSYKVTGISDQGQSVLLTVSKGSESMQLDIPKSEKVHVTSDSFGAPEPDEDEKPKAKKKPKKKDDKGDKGKDDKGKGKKEGAIFGETKGYFLIDQDMNPLPHGAFADAPDDADYGSYLWTYNDAVARIGEVPERGYGYAVREPMPASQYAISYRNGVAGRYVVIPREASKEANSYMPEDNPYFAGGDVLDDPEATVIEDAPVVAPPSSEPPESEPPVVEPPSSSVIEL